MDIGCGTGQLAAALAGEAWGPEVLGCDFSAGMLRAARRRSTRARFVRCDVQELPLKAGSADAVVSTEAFHWFPDQARVLGEIRRVLRPGGVGLIAMVTPPSELISAVTHVGSRAVGAPLYWPTADKMREWAAAAGLRVVEQRRIPRLAGAVLLPPVLTVLERPRRQKPAPRKIRR